MFQVVYIFVQGVLAERFRSAIQPKLNAICLKLLASFSIALLTQSCVANLAELPESAFSGNQESQYSQANHSARNHSDESAPADVSSDNSSTQKIRNHKSFVHQTDELLAQYRTENLPQAAEKLSVPSESAKRSRYSSTQTIAEELDEYTLEAIDAPVSALLFALVSDAGLQLDIRGSLNHQVTLKAVSQSLDNILSMLSEQVGFSWQLSDQLLTVWGGKAYSYNYQINYINISRRTQSSVGLATQVGTINATETNGASIANSSRTLVENTSEHRFWDSLLLDLESMINHSENSSSHAVSGQGSASFTVNREVGLLTVHASPEVHRRVKAYVQLLQQNAERQVLIEATVIEVALSNSYEAGVDWQLLARGVNGLSAAQVLTGAPQVLADTVNRISSPAGLVSLVQQSGIGDLQATLSLLEQFGDVRILSRPRIIALNNQSAILKVVDNRVYFTVNVQRRQSEERDEVVTETQIHTVPVGLVMNVTPQISEQDKVMLNVRPTLSRILGFVDDPNPELALANVRNGVPEIQVREMESMLQVDSGDVAIIGGLMQETHTDNNDTLPGIGHLPFIGRVFGNKQRLRRQTELLIVLRPTVINSSGIQGR